MKTLVEREWVRVVGYRDVPGRPAMYATTRHFLDYFNLKTLDQLPTLNEIRELGERMQAEQQQAIADEEARMLAAQEEKRRQMMAEAQAVAEASGETGEETDDNDDDASTDVDLDNLPEVLTFSEISQRFEERQAEKQQDSAVVESDTDSGSEDPVTDSEGAATPPPRYDRD